MRVAGVYCPRCGQTAGEEHRDWCDLTPVITGEPAPAGRLTGREAQELIEARYADADAG